MTTIAKTAKEERKKYHREWRQKNKEKVKQYNKEYWERRARKLKEAEA